MLHLVLIVTNFVMHSTRIKNLTVKYSLTFIGMLAYIYVIIEIALIIYLSPYPRDAPNLATGGALTWFTVEMWTWYGIIISNTLFQGVRALTGKLPLDLTKGVDEFSRLPTLDTLLAMHDIAVSFHTECVPCVVSSYFNYAKISFQNDDH